MPESFGDKETEPLWYGQRTLLPADLLLRATDKLNLQSRYDMRRGKIEKSAQIRARVRPLVA